METAPPPRPSNIDLPTSLYYQVAHTLTNLLPPPLDDSPEALNVRNRAAIAKVAALLPVNADEVELAAQCIAARAQAEDILLLLRQHRGDIALTARLNAQYGSMVRTSLSVHGHLMKVQALRQKREATASTADQDTWTQHVAEQSALAALDPTTTPFKPAWPAEAQPTLPEPPRPTSPEPAQMASPEGPPLPEQARPTSPEQPMPTPSTTAPANTTNQKTNESTSENETDSHEAAFETWLSEQTWNQGSSGPEETALRLFRESIALGRQTNAEATTNSHQSPSMAG